MTSHPMTPQELCELMDRLSLRAVDVAWMSGYGMRQIGNWMSGHSPVPQTVRLLLTAMRQGHLSPHWFVRNVGSPVPYSRGTYVAQRQHPPTAKTRLPKRTGPKPPRKRYKPVPKAPTEPKPPRKRQKPWSVHLNRRKRNRSTKDSPNQTP